MRAYRAHAKDDHLLVICRGVERHRFCLSNHVIYPTMPLAPFSQITWVIQKLCAIPLRIIWKIEIRLDQKFALFFSLCLLSVLIVATIVRGIGLLIEASLDVVWEIYWDIVSTELGVILAAVAAFSALFVAQQEQAAVEGSHGVRAKQADTTENLSQRQTQ